MSEERNCPNCGAPYDVKLNKCPYCGTSYFDLSCLSINERTPFYLKIKDPATGVIITQLCCLDDLQIELGSDDCCIVDMVGNKHYTMGRRTMGISMNLSALCEPQEKTLYTIAIGEDI